MAGKLDPKKVKVLTNERQTVKDMTEDFSGEKPKYELTQSGNTWILNASDGTGERFLHVDKKGDYTVYDADQVRKAYIKENVDDNTLEEFRTRLYKAGFMTEQEHKTKDSTAFNVAIVRAARKISVDYVSKFTDTNVASTSSFDSWISSQASGGSDEPSAGRDLTDRKNTDQDIDEFFIDMLGRKATPEEKLDYYNKVNKEEKEAIKRTKKSGGVLTTTGEYLDETDYYRIRSEVLKPAVRGTSIEKITSGNGTIARNVSELKAFAASYGIKYDSKQALDSVMSGMTPGSTLTKGTLDAQKNSIKEMSKAFYGKLAPLIEQGVKVSDIASQFAYYKGQTLELPDNAVSVFDEDIQEALKNEGKDGVMTLTDYQKLLRTNPKTKPIWLKTKGAKEEASGYAYEILKSFGLMA